MFWIFLISLSASSGTAAQVYNVQRYEFHSRRLGCAEAAKLKSRGSTRPASPLCPLAEISSHFHSTPKSFWEASQVLECKKNNNPLSLPPPLSSTSWQHPLPPNMVTAAMVWRTASSSPDNQHFCSSSHNDSRAHFKSQDGFRVTCLQLLSNTDFTAAYQEFCGLVKLFKAFRCLYD